MISVRKARWRRIQLTSAMILGWIATQIQCIAGTLIAITTLAVFVFQSESILNQLARLEELYVAVLYGSVFFPLIVTPMFLLFQGPTAYISVIRDNPQIRKWLYFFVFFGPATVEIPRRLNAPWSFILLGIVIGILIDITRRKGIQAQREHLSLEKALRICRILPIPNEIEKAIKECSLHPLRHPLFPAISPKVFISYTRSSNWSIALAKNLHKKLLNINVKSFLDRENIGEGSNWRNQLNRSLASTNVFITIIDKNSIDREWVAAEMITALMSKSLTSLPEVIVLTDGELSSSTIDKGLPIFASILSEQNIHAQEARIRIIPVINSTLDTLISGLMPNRYTVSSVFPAELFLFFSFLTILLVALGPIGSIAGFPAAIFAYLQYWDKVDSSAIMLAWNIMPIVYLITAYWLGFTCRLAFASKYEVKHRDYSMLSKIHAFSSLGLGCILAVWISDVSALIISWSLAVCYIGWLLGNLFISRTVKENPALNVG